MMAGISHWAGKVSPIVWTWCGLHNNGPSSPDELLWHYKRPPDISQFGQKVRSPGLKKKKKKKKWKGRRREGEKEVREDSCFYSSRLSLLSIDPNMFRLHAPSLHTHMHIHAASEWRWHEKSVCSADALGRCRVVHSPHSFLRLWNWLMQGKTIKIGRISVRTHLEQLKIDSCIIRK